MLATTLPIVTRLCYDKTIVWRWYIYLFFWNTISLLLHCSFHESRDSRSKSYAVRGVVSVWSKMAQASFLVQTASLSLRGPYPQKITKLKKVFLLLTKYQHTADVLVEFYGCATCLRGVHWGLNGTIQTINILNFRILTKITPSVISVF